VSEEEVLSQTFTTEFYNTTAPIIADISNTGLVTMLFEDPETLS
jgi:hypothetical protein